MDRLKGLRPNLAELLKQDLSRARPEPLAAPEAPPPMTRAAASEAFAERISQQHAVEARDGKTRPSAAAEAQVEPQLVAHRHKRRRREEP